MTSSEILNEMAEVKTKIQDIQLWIDNSPSNLIARIRHDQTHRQLKELKKDHQALTTFYNLAFPKGELTALPPEPHQ